jgi:enterochelin esterase-like enzyme
MKRLTKTSYYFLLLFLAILTSSCDKQTEEMPDPYAYKQFESFSEFNQTLEEVASIEEESLRTEKLNALWDSLKTNKQIPFVHGDSAAFLYRGDAEIVKWAGDFNGWNPNYEGFSGEKVGLSNIWMVKAKFPLDARLDYKIVRNTTWILDTSNPNIQYSGFGPNSELRMPDWVFPSETILDDGANRGTLTSTITIISKPENLGYIINYKVYIPFGYNGFDNLPVVYVTDGHEYSDDRLGAMLIVMDNLIHQGNIKPIIAVFIDPREPGNTSNNRRMSEYRANIKFANFVADELVPHVDANYKTDPRPVSRAILGTSLGGWNSAYFGHQKSETFGLIAIHSPAFDEKIIEAYASTEKLPLKIFMSTGTIFDTQVRARQMKEILEEKQYPHHYIEVNEGHSWGNWRALIDEPLRYFFPKN